MKVVFMRHILMIFNQKKPWVFFFAQYKNKIWHQNTGSRRL